MGNCKNCVNATGFGLCKNPVAAGFTREAVTFWATLEQQERCPEYVERVRLAPSWEPIAIELDDEEAQRWETRAPLLADRDVSMPLPRLRRLLGMLALRDRDDDERVSCLECRLLTRDMACRARGPVVLDLLQRCPTFQRGIE